MKDKITIDEKIKDIDETIKATEEKRDKLNEQLKQLSAKKEKLEEEKRLCTFSEAEVILGDLGTDMSALIAAIQSGKIDISALKKAQDTADN
ncbi:MAG TPA: hypothetical protein DEP65_06955 [Ruminococcus sp.]|nr:hypothetical protein [Ruminococcus sp.]